ncbi:TPA: phage tail protein [Citrobacter freundii]|nr:phage tail protein [Citrobacter freundii]HCA1845660.1 phage tail protein [Citrobacter freundii]
MANLPETPQWEDGIYQIEVSDPVLGGPDGISNRQAKQLAKRTSYLKQQVENGDKDLADHIAAPNPHTQYAPKESPALTGTPTAPTAIKTDNSTKLATTGHVKNVVADYAPLASPGLTGKPTAPTAAQASNDTQLATTAFVKAALAALVASSPEALDTLNELAAALGNDPNFATTMTNALAGKQPLDSTLTALSGKSVSALLEYLHLEELPNFAKYGAPMIGELIEWPSDKMPNEIYPDMKMEFIPYIGQSFDPVKYPLLATLHPNLRLPADMRANVARGWDWGRGIDAGRVLMSAQDDAMQRITGELTDMCSGDSLQATGALTITAKPAQHWYAAATVSSAYLYYRAIGFDNASVARTANENRMKNVAWNMIVRAK